MGLTEVDCELDLIGSTTGLLWTHRWTFSFHIKGAFSDEPVKYFLRNEGLAVWSWRCNKTLYRVRWNLSHYCSHMINEMTDSCAPLMSGCQIVLLSFHWVENWHQSADPQWNLCLAGDQLFYLRLYSIFISSKMAVSGAFLAKQIQTKQSIMDWHESVWLV
jgi:hypothetical protein